MKIMFISDIHGSVVYAEKAIEKFEREGYDKLVILGDILYYDSYYALSQEFSTKKVATLLNKHKDNIIAIRGNCDKEAHQSLLEFEMMDDYKEIMLIDRKIFITHGHLYNREQMPRLNKGDLFVHGHFHVAMTEVLGDVYYLNPGSVSLPRNNSRNSYGVLEDGIFSVWDFEGNLLKDIRIL